MAYTPGPWYFEEEELEFSCGDKFFTGRSITDGDTVQIAIIPSDQALDFIEDGRLLASAPDLLKARNAQQTLLLKIRAELELRDWSTRLAQLVNEIDDLLGEAE